MPYPRIAASAATLAVLLGFSLVASALPPGSDAQTTGLRVPPGWKVELFAAEPQLGNPVAFCLDERGRIYVAEEYRFNRGTEENRSRPFLLDDDLQLRTVADRLAMFRKWADRFEGGMAWFSKYSDQVRLLEDSDDDGRADRSIIFAQGFNAPLDGLAAGILARDGDVYFTCIPNLWLLRDTDGDGRADVRKSLQYGFGVNASFLGHDLHGLVWGPDGKLYFSVGDRGFHVETPEGKALHGPGTGAVFRCEADGSALEVVARGLRNPQELAFDPYGNLFAADNNCDKGDHSRLVFVVEGGDSGWNMSYQTLAEPYLTGPWHAERMWHLPHAGQPAWIVPPVGKLGAGPSGFVAYPGVGLADRYRDHFFYCDFTSDGGVKSFIVRPKGAGFVIDDMHDVVTPVMATDVDFGYDGKMYLSEFGKLEWDGSNQSGRIYRVYDPERQADAAVLETKALFKEGFRQRGDVELVRLIHHPDMRVRLRAQFILAERGETAIARFEKVAATHEHVTARLHAIWGLGQVGRKHSQALRSVLALLGDADARVRAQAAKVIGDARYAPAAGSLVALLSDPNPQVRFHAAIALSKLGHRPAVEPIFAMLRNDDGRDPFLRHAGVMALAGSGDLDAIWAAAKDSRPSVRMAVLLVGRRLGDPRVANFLDDADLAIVSEAARAINDLPIDAGTGTLAKLIDRTGRPGWADAVEPLLRRVINANYRVGGPVEARAVAAFAADTNRSPVLRAEAIAALGDWSNAPARDRVNGFWRPLPKRDPAVVRGAVQEWYGRILASSKGSLLAKAVGLFAKLDVAAPGKVILDLLGDRAHDPAARLAALRWLSSRKDALIYDGIQTALASENPPLRGEARGILATLDARRAVPIFRQLLDDFGAPIVERQAAIASLAGMKTPESDALLARWANVLAAGEAAPEIQLDIVEAATTRGTPELRQALERLDVGRSTKDIPARFRHSLSGGDAARGRSLFIGHVQAQCVRCHAVDGAGGKAAPDLAKVASRGDRDYLLRSMIEPDARVVPGYETVVLELKDGRIVSGVTKAEKDGTLAIETSEGRHVSVATAEIEERSPSRSAMPKMGDILSPRELRDLVEYLSTLK
jgi:quinoprotein glucose dehydrogenase